MKNRLLLLLLLDLYACGPHIAVTPVILPANTQQSCDRAIKCGIFLPEQRDACINCLEYVDPKWVAMANEYLEGKPLDTVSCDELTYVAHTNLSTCVVARWYGP